MSGTTLPPSYLDQLDRREQALADLKEQFIALSANIMVTMTAYAQFTDAMIAFDNAERELNGR